jgi:hypothetical protein
MIVGLGMSASVTICIVLLVNTQNRANLFGFSPDIAGRCASV